MLHTERKIGLSEINIVCNTVEGHCVQALKFVHHHANGCFDWLISGHQSVNPSKEAISILSGKYIIVCKIPRSFERSALQIFERKALLNI